MRKGLFASFKVHIYLDSSVAFRLLAFRKDVLWFLYRSLKFIASPTYDSVVVGVSEGCVVVSVSFFEVYCQSYVRFCRCWRFGRMCCSFCIVL